MDDDEIWKDVVGYKGLYQISNKVRMKSLPRVVNRKNGTLHTVRGKILKLTDRGDGYLVVVLRGHDNKYKIQLVHRLLATAFLPNPDNKPEINHKDADKGNQALENLEWATHKENMQHASRKGLMKGSPRPGELNPAAKLTSRQVREIRRILGAGEKIVRIAKRFNISATVISDIKHGKIWRTVR